MAFSPEGDRIVSEDSLGKRLAWDSITGQPVDAGNERLPPNQKEAKHPGANLHVRIDGMLLIVHRLDYIPRPEPDRNTPADMVRWHGDQAADGVQKEQWFAAAFHLERLVRLQPWDAPLRSRLEEALEQAPDSAATKTVRRRLTEHDMARRVRLIPSAFSPWSALPLVPLGLPAAPAR